MKYLQDYKQEAQDRAFKEANAFFAFNKKQVKEGIKEGLQYSNIGQGLICEKGKEVWLINELERIHLEAIIQDYAENGKEAIIRRELNNHEAGYTGRIDDTARALKDYRITEKEIRHVFRGRKLKELLNSQ